MSDTVKLIIEVSKEDIELIRKTSFVEDERTMFKQSPSDRQGTMMLFRVMDSVKNGTPLDDIETEMKQKAWDTQEVDGEHDNYKVVDASDVFEILDSIGKGNKE